MWDNAQCDGRPAEYRWRPLFNAAKFGWRLLLQYRAVTLSKRETSWNLQGCLKLAISRPKFTIWWGHVGETYCCLTNFFPIVDTCLSCEDIARQTCAMARRWRIFGIFWVLHFQRATCSTFQTCILNLHYGHIMCGSMVDIQSATSEIRRGKR